MYGLPSKIKNKIIRRQKKLLKDIDENPEKYGVTREHLQAVARMSNKNTGGIKHGTGKKSRK